MTAPITIRRLAIRSPERQLVDLSLTIGRATALVGESGSGKSLTLKALLGLLPATLQTVLEIDAPFPLLCGTTVALVPQNPFTAFSPLTPLGKQFQTPRDAAADALVRLGLSPDLLAKYPSQLSGGQLQRIAIAMALLASPRLLLLDEPTTALDPATRAGITELLDDLVRHESLSLLYVTHDIASIRHLCPEMAVIRDGRIVDRGATADLIGHASHPYTRALVEADFTQRTFRT